MLLTHFRDGPGYEKVRIKEYGLMEGAMGREIMKSSIDIRRDILPGQKIVQDISFLPTSMSMA